MNKILVGDVLDMLATLPDESVNCVVTSPPYWGLRDYGVAGQIGLEPTIEEYVAKQVAVFREVRRVLRSDGVCFVNYGDSYSAGKPRDQEACEHGGMRFSNKQSFRRDRRPREDDPHKSSLGLRPKDLCGIPWRVALALQADGWWLRSDIVWAKPNPMPESVTDRPTKAHEYIFMLTKNAKYWCDMDAVREPSKSTITKMPDGWDTGNGSHGTIHRNGREKGQRHAPGCNYFNYAGNGECTCGIKKTDRQQTIGVNLRTVWNIATHPFPEAHFATFPPEIPRRCILIGCPQNGVVLDPFIGSGTTAVVAQELGRQWIGIELSPEYAEMANRRIRGEFDQAFKDREAKEQAGQLSII